MTSFPFSDLKAHKNRPALVLGFSDFNDVVLCQITSISDGDMKKIHLTKNSFSNGGLPVDSYVRPEKIFTADISLISRKVGTLNDKTLASVKLTLKEFFDL